MDKPDTRLGSFGIQQDIGSNHFCRHLMKCRYINKDIQSIQNIKEEFMHRCGGRYKKTSKRVNKKKRFRTNINVLTYEYESILTSTIVFLTLLNYIFVTYEKLDHSPNSI